MQWIIQFIVRHRAASSLLLTVVLSIAMLSSPEARQQSIARGLTMSIFFPFQFTFNQLAQARNIYAENRRLKEELASLRASSSLLAEQAAENKRLRRLLNLRQHIPYTLIPARVIAREPSPLYRSLVVNAGKANNIELYMPVVSNDGVVGKIVHLLNHICLVQVIRDPSARTSVMAQKSRSVGILETENGRNFYIRYRTHVDVQPGDTIVTSGLGGIYPKGLLTGFITRISEGNDPLFKKVFIRLSVDFSHLEDLFVVRLAPRWTVLRSELDSIEMEK
jgi:rod shape-determining protein MreC